MDNGFEPIDTNTVDGRIERQLQEIAKHTKLDNLKKIIPAKKFDWKYFWATLISVISLIFTGYLGYIATEFSYDHQAINYTFENYQPNSEKIIPDTKQNLSFTFTPFMSVSIDRNHGGLAQGFFIGDFNSKDEVVITQAISVNSAKEVKNYPINIDFKPDGALKNQIAYATKTHSNPFSWDVKNKIYFFDSRLQFEPTITKPVIKFLIIKGINGDYQVITFIEGMGQKVDHFKDVNLNFNGLEIYSNQNWEHQASNYSKETKQNILALQEDAQHQYAKLSQFLQSNLVQ